jgi:hypothetical protein
MGVRAGDAGRAREAMAWARENLDLIQSEWVRLNRRM